ncbi:hypothetical protein ACLOJK_024168 [Asimina triloba]
MGYWFLLVLAVVNPVPDSWKPTTVMAWTARKWSALLKSTGSSMDEDAGPGDCFCQPTVELLAGRTVADGSAEGQTVMGCHGSSIGWLVEEDGAPSYGAPWVCCDWCTCSV